jgi:hypothetical protein
MTLSISKLIGIAPPFGHREPLGYAVDCDDLALSDFRASSPRTEGA